MDLEKNTPPNDLASTALSPLEAWLKRISEQDMPVFDRTARVVTGVTWRQNSNAQQLAGAILQDPSFTAKVLRMANSVFYNPSKKQVGTITRAVVVLGFDAVRSICLTVAVMDSLNGGNHKDHVLSETARSFHAAVQAKNLSTKLKKGASEEIYTAALLARIGELAFWCFAGEQGKELQLAMQKPNARSAQVQSRILGFRLKDLSASLCREWNLGELLQRTIADTPADRKDSRIQVILAGHEIAQAALAGWSNPESKQKLHAMAKQFHIAPREFFELLAAGAEEAAEAVDLVGGANLGRLIPLPEESAARVKPAHARIQAPESSPYCEPNKELQAQVMEDVGKLLQQQFDPNILLGVINEGLYRGVGLDRIFFGLLTPDRRQLKAKHIVGWSQQKGGQLVIELPENSQSVLLQVMQQATPAWVMSTHEEPALATLTQGAGILLAPVLAGKEVLGLFYADRAPSKRPLDAEAFRQFVRFVARATEGFTLASMTTIR